MVPPAHRPRAAPGPAGPHQRPGRPRHPSVARPAGVLRLSRLQGAGHLVGGAGLHGLRRALRRRRRLPLARVRARHRVQDQVAERRRLLHRVVHAAAPAHAVALVACAPPHRHDRGGARPRDHVPPPVVAAQGARGVRAGDDPPQGGVAHPQARRGTHRRRRPGLHTHRRAAQAQVGVTGLHRRAGRHRGVVRRHRLDRAGAVHRVADLLRGLAHGVLRGDAARRSARRRARPPLQLTDRVHEPGPEVPVLEHELPRRAPHLPHGAVLRAAGPPR